MIDTHCHLDVGQFDADREAVLERAWGAGVTGLVIPAIGPDAWEPLLGWPARDRRFQVALGLHPQLLAVLSPAQDEAHLARLDTLLSLGIACAVGECGLDGPSQAHAPMERQVTVLRRHFALAAAHRLPVLVHCLRAHPHLVRVLREERTPARGVLLHSYSGSADLTRFYVSQGCHFSFCGPVTFEGARRPLEALRSVPLDRLMVETDAPDQAPHPFRGQRSEPAYLPLIVEAMARARGEPVAMVREAVTQNARRFFRAFAEP